MTNFVFVFVSPSGQQFPQQHHSNATKEGHECVFVTFRDNIDNAKQAMDVTQMTPATKKKSVESPIEQTHRHMKQRKYIKDGREEAELGCWRLSVQPYTDKRLEKCK
jgi:hypothetical protein